MCSIDGSFPSEKIRAVAGEHDLEVDEGPEQVRSVTEQRRHPFYFHLIMPFNDIALFRVGPQTIDQTIKWFS